jgi:hypothetical protein
MSNKKKNFGILLRILQNVIEKLTHVFQIINKLLIEKILSQVLYDGHELPSA